MPWQWLTTSPTGRTHTCTIDCGQTGWRLHAVQAEESEPSAQLGRRRAACGLVPASGWGLDLFIDQRCRRCERALGLAPAS